MILLIDNAIHLFSGSTIQRINESANQPINWSEATLWMI